MKKLDTKPTGTTASETTARNYHQRWLITVFWLIAILLGIINTWDGRHTMGPDGISYLDIGDAYFRGDWNMAINAYWSPFYSWLLGLAMFLLKPSPYYEFTVVHIVNFVIYLCALGCFHFFLIGSLRYHRNWTSSVSKDGYVTLPEWTLLALGYILFIWSSLHLIGIPSVTPDMCVSAFVYLILGILLRIRRGLVSRPMFIILGVILGFAYLAKTAMFLLAFIFLGCSVFLVGNLRKAIPRVLIALVIFILIASPFILVISNAKGRFTFGDAGKLNYLWQVDGITCCRHWQGEPVGSGTPKHTTRKLSSMPEIYEFGTPIGGTYPVWYDPSYWYEGIKFNFGLRKQISALKSNIITIIRMLFIFKTGIIIYGALIFYFMRRRLWLFMKDIAEHWSLLIPAISALAIYSMVLVECRYISPFIVVLWMGIFSGVRLPDSQESRRLITYTTPMLLLIITLVSIQIAPKTYSVIRYLIKGEDSSVHVQWQVTNVLKKMGVQPGDKVVCIGKPYNDYWARLARVRIVAEIPLEDSITLRELEELVNSQVIQILVGTGAKFIVTEIIPQKYITNADWQRIGNTDYYIYALKR